MQLGQSLIAKTSKVCYIFKKSYLCFQMLSILFAINFSAYSKKKSIGKEIHSLKYLKSLPSSHYLTFNYHNFALQVISTTSDKSYHS